MGPNQIQPTNDERSFDMNAYMNYTGENIWNAVYTIQLGELIENGIFDWNDDLINWADAAYNLEQYKRVCNYFIQRFMFREISIVPYYEWGVRLRMKLVYELMPKYRVMYEFLDNRFDIAQEESTETLTQGTTWKDFKRDLGNERGVNSARELGSKRTTDVLRNLGNQTEEHEARGLGSMKTIDTTRELGNESRGAKDRQLGNEKTTEEARGLESTRTIDETRHENTTGNRDTTGHETGTENTTGNEKTDTYDKSRKIGSGYPETLLSANSDYVSTGEDSEGETVGTKETAGTKETISDTTGNEKTTGTEDETKNTTDHYTETEKKSTNEKTNEKEHEDTTGTLNEKEQTDTTEKLNESETIDTTGKLDEQETTGTQDNATEAEQTKTKDIFNEVESSLTNDKNDVKSTVLTRGNLLDSYLRYQQEYQNIDKMLVDELECMFIGLYTMNTNVL